jgi:hypothetical protein
VGVLIIWEFFVRFVRWGGFWMLWGAGGPLEGVSFHYSRKIPKFSRVSMESGIPLTDEDVIFPIRGWNPCEDGYY